MRISDWSSDVCSSDLSPLQAPADLIAKYKGRYDDGWDALRRDRLARMKALGLIGDDTAPAPLRPDSTAWSKLSPAQRQVESRKMEIYAAMVDRMDQNVRRLITYLTATDRKSQRLNSSH